MFPICATHDCHSPDAETHRGNDAPWLFDI
jgi:hypothetical protein